MRNESLETARSLVKAAIADPGDRAELLKLLTPKPTQDRDKLLTSKQAAEIAQTCVKTLFRWEKAGHLHATRATRSRIRWSKAELERFLSCEAARAEA
jgi:hypothetical protein